MLSDEIRMKNVPRKSEMGLRRLYKKSTHGSRRSCRSRRARASNSLGIDINVIYVPVHLVERGRCFADVLSAGCYAS